MKCREGESAMEAAAVEAVVDGLKRAGVDFISLLPDSDFSALQHQVANDRHFTCVPVSSEAIGVGVCAGAYLSGRRPALLVASAGLLVAGWPPTGHFTALSLPRLCFAAYLGSH